MRGFSTGILLLFMSLASQAKAIDYAFCWADKDNLRVCQEVMEMGRDYPDVCRAFAVQEAASYYGYRYSSDREHLETSMGQHCDLVRDGGQGGIFACLLETYCPDEGSTRTLHLASRVYASEEAQGIQRCININQNKVIREIREQSAAGCYIRVKTEPYSLGNGTDA